MDRREAVRQLGVRVPVWLRRLRARLLLEQFAECIGLEEVPCPACGGDGWLDRACLEACPICRGFADVPISLAEWFEDRLPSAQTGLPAGRVPPVEAPPGPEEARYGRCAELPCTVSLSDIPGLPAPDLEAILDYGDHWT